MHRAATLVATTVVLALGGCSSSPIKATAPDKADTAACRKASAAWPTTVAGHGTHPVTSSSPAVRAWGGDADKAVIARCGVQMPGPTTDPCVQADDVDWVQHRLDDGYVFTTYGRDPAIEVLVPDGNGTAPLLLSAFTKAAHSIPQGPHRCQ